MESHCETMWEDNSGSGLGRHLTSDYGTAADDDEKQALIYQQPLRSKITSLWIKNSLNTVRNVI